MHLRVLFFGVLRERFGTEQPLHLPEGSTAGLVLQHFREAAAPLAGIWPSVAIAVNQQYASLTTPLKDGDEVALLPPVSGGSANFGAACR